MFALIHVPRLQPFEDVNTRVSRLAANIPFLRMNLVPLSFVDVPKNLYASGLLSVYELNRPDLLRDLFVWAYERSCRRYSTARRLPGAPDLFRMQYREPIRKLVSNVVHARMNKGRAAARIKAFALGWVPVDDQQRFIESRRNRVAEFARGQRRPLSCSSNGIPQLAAVLVTSRFHQFPMIHTTDPISVFSRERNIGNRPCLSQVNTKPFRPIF